MGRITDWHKKTHSVSEYAPAEDPGVNSVKRIYGYYKQYGTHAPTGERQHN